MANITEIRSILSLPATHTSLAVRQVNTAAAQGSGVRDQANLSGASGLISAALEIPDVRYDKVAELQQRIADGTYAVPAAEVAGKLLESLLG